MNKALASIGLAAVLLAPASLALAQAPVAKVTGGITMSGPSQQISFVAFDGAGKGNVSYTNYDYPGGLSYSADVLCANVNETTDNAVFVFQIPAGFPGLSGLYVGVQVHDGGTPGTNGDTYGHTSTASQATAMSWCNSSTLSVTNYPITSGNLVVH